MAVIGQRVKVKRRDWLAAVAMSAGIGLFPGLAAPSGGRPHAAGSSWWLAGLVTFGIVLLALGVAVAPGRRPGASRSRQAALLGAAAGIEHIQAGALDLAGEALALAIVLAGATALSHSHLIVGEDGNSPGPAAGYQPHGHGERARR